MSHIGYTLKGKYQLNASAYCEQGNTRRFYILHFIDIYVFHGADPVRRQKCPLEGNLSPEVHTNGTICSTLHHLLVFIRVVCCNYKFKTGKHRWLIYILEVCWCDMKRTSIYSRELISSLFLQPTQ